MCILVFEQSSNSIIPSWSGLPFVFFCEGAIELSILADYYGREIAAYDIQTTRCDLYGQVSSVQDFLLEDIFQLRIT